MANITDIAKELDIAPSTVSRALKKPDLVSLDTRHKVLQMAEKLGYLQKLRDDATAATATNLIGVIVADLTNSFSNQIVKAVHDSLENSGYSAIVVIKWLNAWSCNLSCSLGYCIRFSNR